MLRLLIYGFQNGGMLFKTRKKTKNHTIYKLFYLKSLSHGRNKRKISIHK